MTYEVALPTYNRVDTLLSKTLPMLKSYKISPSKITLFVANQEQKELYASKVPKEDYGKIVIGVKGLANVRNFITEYYPLGTHIFHLDDDISKFEILKDGKLVPLPDLDKLIKDAFDLCKKNHLHLWGIAPVRNAFYMKDDITTNLKFIIGHTFGFINRRIKVHSDFKDDYERTLENAVRDGGVLRFNNVVATTKLGAKGGVNKTAEERKKDTEHKEFIEWLKQKYQGLVRDNPKREREILLARSLKQYKPNSSTEKSEAGATRPNPLPEGKGKRLTEEEKEKRAKELLEIAKKKREEKKEALLAHKKEVSEKGQPPKNEISEEDKNDDSITKLPIRNLSKYKEARENLLNALKLYTIPKIPKARKPGDTKTATGRGDVIGTNGRTLTLGFGDNRHGWNFFRSNDKYPEVYKALIEFGNQVVPKGWDYQTITLNHNAKAKKHKDSKNVGKSVIIGIGDFTGGEIRVWDKSGNNHKDYNLHDVPLMFNGGLLFHETQPFTIDKYEKGKGRYTMIFYRQGRKPRSGDVGKGV